ncbi:hypothetical protein FSARC_4746 [Fusarium sarcochroum]|uniref:Nucleoside phosphorylase domain-containing protein n=1 Tax=Fusarium sarcochroum TaxID=1208366 RepID=A0A8H4XAB9_9HYPO|nr:hypothetical protein FSARC_4746 [Fusarium sarcochroum]
MSCRQLPDSDDEARSRPPKRRKTSRLDMQTCLPYYRYTVAWICALHTELAAARAMLDEIHQDLPRCANDDNTYTLGSIEQHNVVISCSPQYGTNHAANVLTNMTRTFPSIQFGLVVGIGGGVPGKVDIRLGDIVVGTRVMQYDLEKVMTGGEIQRIATPKFPESFLRSAVMALRARHELQPSRVPTILQERMSSHAEYCHPRTPDRLFRASYRHRDSAFECHDCDQSQLKERETRRNQDPMIHHGGIASGNRVMKDAAVRDHLARELDVVCFEMEAAGLMDVLPCLPIRGICDYSDSHKSKEWQRYAAATAGAYAREFLEVLAPGYNATREPCSTASSVRLEQNDSINRRKQLLESLKFQQIHARKADIKTAYSKTCQWFLGHPDYLDWLDPGKRQRHHGFLWIRGKPGVGKSTIMKFIYTRMKKKDQPQKTLTSSFFFNARGDDVEKSVSGMYRSLLLQLLEGFPDLQRALDDDDLVPRNQKTCHSLNVLKDLFRAAVSFLGNRSCTCFVDALDECDEQQVMDMIEFFEEISEQCTENGVKLQFCFSSRHYPYFDIRTGVRLTLESQAGHTKDLESYINSHLQIGNSALIAELKPTILEKAAGIFLWVALVVRILNRENRRGRPAVRKRLAEVPSGLSDLFKDLLMRDQEDMNGLLLSILWILFVQRPLRPGEYYHALWFELSPEDLADLEMLDTNGLESSDRYNKFVISSSKGLAEISKAGVPTVQFIHESVRDFLIKDKGFHELWPELGADWESRSHERLKSCCNAYIHHQKVKESLHAQRFEATLINREDILKQYPLLEYASLFLLSHSNAAAGAICQRQFLNKFHVPYWIHAFNIFRKSMARYTQEADILYILADNGLSSLIRTRLEEDPNIDIPGERFRYPLLAAMAKNNKDSVVALLCLSSSFYDGTDVTAGLTPRLNIVRKQHTPFSWTCEQGYFSIAKILFHKGAYIDKINEESWVGLVGALDNEHMGVAMWLIEKGAAIETKDISGQTLLLLAARRGDEAIMRLLLNKAADIKTKDKSGRTPLFWAATRRDIAMAQLLLDEGADIKPDRTGQMLLLLFAKSGRKDTLQLLLDIGLGIETRDEVGQTPLLLAAEQGNMATMQLLLEKGADIEATNCRGQTALSQAIEERVDETAVQLLLDNRADVDTRDGLGITPLLLAIEQGDAALAERLLKKGADTKTKDILGRTALSQAVCAGHAAMVQLLINMGQDIKTEDYYGFNLPQQATRRGHRTVEQLLYTEAHHQGYEYPPTVDDQSF